MQIVPRYITSGVCQDITKAIEEGGFKITFYPAGVQNFAYEGKSYGVLGRLRRGGKVEVYVDSGIRRGTDVLKAIACGARAVFIGRPVLRRAIFILRSPNEISRN